MKIDPATMQYIKQVGKASSIGLAMALSVVFGFLLGWFVDNQWPNLSPWGKMIGLGMGIAAAFRNLFIMVNRIKREMEADEQWRQKNEQQQKPD